ncbi:MAG: phage baseplate assembly protein [Alphaproteobacteria bacterium]|nr:phage baseplate assembly protein [Alphaproteobacteria bacterium]
MDMLAALSDLMRPLRNRVALMISRAVLAGLNDGAGLQVVQLKVRDPEDLHAGERFQNYGLTSVPLAGADVLVVAIGGITSHLAVAAIDDRRYRPKNLKAGEVMLYDHLGKFIKLAEDGTLHIKAPKIIIEGDETAELRGGKARVHSETETAIDCAGHGEKWLPTKKDTWTIGAVAGSSNAINPPEIP